MAGPNCPPSSSPQVSTWYEGGMSMSRASMAEGAWSFIGLELKSSHLGKEYFKFMFKIVFLQIIPASRQVPKPGVHF